MLLALAARAVNHGQIGVSVDDGCMGEGAHEGLLGGAIVDHATGEQQVARETTGDDACSYPRSSASHDHFRIDKR